MAAISVAALPTLSPVLCHPILVCHVLCTRGARGASCCCHCNSIPLVQASCSSQQAACSGGAVPAVLACRWWKTP